MDKTCLCRLLYLELQDVARRVTASACQSVILAAERKSRRKVELRQERGEK